MTQPPAGRMLQRIVQKIGCRLLHFLIVEAEVRNGRIEGRVQPHAFALECLEPSLRQFIQAVPHVVLAKLQNQFSALQRRIVQEHGHQAHEPFAALFGFFQNVALFLRQTSQRTGQQQIVISLDDREWRLQFMRCRSQKHRFLPVDFLQFQIRREQISIGDLAFLQQFLDGDLRCRIGRGQRFRLGFSNLTTSQSGSGIHRTWRGHFSRRVSDPVSSSCWPLSILAKNLSSHPLSRDR